MNFGVQIAGRLNGYELGDGNRVVKNIDKSAGSVKSSGTLSTPPEAREWNARFTYGRHAATSCGRTERVRLLALRSPRN